jgi:hypothetical protein
MNGREVRRRICLVGFLLLAGPLIAPAQEAGANRDPYWPSERAKRVEEINARVKEMLQQSSTAGYVGRLDEKARVVQQIEALKREGDRLREAPVSASGAE